MTRGAAVYALTLTLLATSTACASQTTLNCGTRDGKQTPSSSERSYFEFTHPIKRVAVIGAGTGGVQHAAALVDHGFEVRLFERKPNAGGVWSYSSRKPLHAPFP